MKRIMTIVITIVILTAAVIFIAFNVRSEKAFDLNDPETWYAPSVKNEVALEDAEKITVGMSFESIVALLGRPLRDEGSGGWIMVWQLENGDDLKIAFKRIPGTQISGDLIAFDINYRKPESDPATVGGAGDLVKALKETDSYNTPYKDLSSYSYSDFFWGLTQTKKPSSLPAIDSASSRGTMNLIGFDESFPIKRLKVVNDDFVCAEYKLDKDGKLIHVFIVFERGTGRTKSGEDFEYWLNHGEEYFAYPELCSTDLMTYKGKKCKVESLEFLIDLDNTIFMSGPDIEQKRSEETLLLKDGYIIIDYFVTSPDNEEITFTDITFIPYGEKCDKYPYNSLIANAYVPDFGR